MLETISNSVERFGSLCRFPRVLSAGACPVSAVMKVASWIVPFFSLQSQLRLLMTEFLPNQIKLFVLYESFPKIPDLRLIRILFGKAKKFQKQDPVIRHSFKSGIGQSISRLEYEYPDHQDLIEVRSPTLKGDTGIQIFHMWSKPFPFDSRVKPGFFIPKLPCTISVAFLP